jgi:alpha-tubulin suppressor-like RCC1 family protein
VASSVDPASASGVTAVAIAAGNAHACAVTSEGGVKCWGDNTSGQLGDGTLTLRTTPVDVCQTYDESSQECTELLFGVTAVEAGAQHTCALTEQGAVKCWGWNFYGQLGTEATCRLKGIILDTASGPFIEDQPCSTTPVQVSGLSDAVAIAAGSYHNCALTKSGGVKCWGWNYAGQVGDGSDVDRRMAADVCEDYDVDAQVCAQALSGVVAIGIGWNYSCAVTSAGAVRCWGSNDLDQLGAETDELCTDPGGRLIDCSRTPVKMRGFENGIASVALGTGFTCAVTTAGGASCRGGNGLGGLGDGQRCGIVCPDPVDVHGLTSGVSALAAGAAHQCALTAPGAVYCWGANNSGQLGRETAEQCSPPSPPISCGTVPARATGLATGVVAVAGGQFFTCAVTAVGGVKCWGANCCGQLGNGTMDGGQFPPPAHFMPSRVVGFGPKLPGDADCSGDVASLDAALILQRAAGLLTALPCPPDADANQDGAVDALDAALALQIVAGLFRAP